MHEAEPEREDDQVLVQRLQKVLSLSSDCSDASESNESNVSVVQNRFVSRNEALGQKERTVLESAVSDDAMRLAAKILESAGTLARTQLHGDDVRHPPYEG
ncbi:hypothetical protein [Candidatus Poriferisodalis sp.]|uniref:hypothetical protein n=1 Tax=Candidatus Poriferisodalis sp. TaxID=3101277 RepID=UPI003AF6E119